MTLSGELAIFKSIKQIAENTSEIATTLKSIDKSLKKIADNENECCYKSPELTDKGKELLNEYRTMLFKKGDD